MKNRFRRSMRYGTVLLMLVFAGCVTRRQAHLPDGSMVPTTFSAVADTVAVAVQPWQHFFTDSGLVQLLEDAVANNYDMQMASQRVQMAAAGILSSRAALAPTVGLNTFGSNIRYGMNTMDGLGNATTPGVPQPIVPSYMLGVSSSWEPDLWGKLRNMKRAAKHRFLAAGMGRNLVVTNLVADVAYRYYELVSLNDELDIIMRNIVLQDAALEIVKVQKVSGKATELAVKQFTAQLLHTRSREYEIRRNMQRIENEINMLRGGEPQGLNISGSIFAHKLPTVASVGVPTQLLANRPDIMLAGEELHASAADMGAARAALYPSLSITAHAGLNAFNPGMLWDPASLALGLVGSISGPLINRRFYKAGLNRAVAQNSEAWYKYGRTVLGAVYEVRTTLGNIDNQTKQFDLIKEEAGTLTDAISISKDLYLAGYASYLEVITAQKNAVEAELNVVKSRKQLFFSSVDLYRALGGGWR